MIRAPFCSSGAAGGWRIRIGRLVALKPGGDYPLDPQHSQRKHWPRENCARPRTAVARHLGRGSRASGCTRRYNTRAPNATHAPSGWSRCAPLDRHA